MKVRYRILEERTAEGGWETIGVITDWESEPAHLRLSGIVQHTISTSIWRVILQRVRERHLTLESYDEAIGDYADDYRLHPDIHIIEAETPQEIRRQLRERYLYAQQAEVVGS
jgi:hypothetical protein